MKKKSVELRKYSYIFPISPYPRPRFRGFVAKKVPPDSRVTERRLTWDPAPLVLKRDLEVLVKVYMQRPVYIFAFGEYNSKQVNVSGIQHFLAQF